MNRAVTVVALVALVALAAPVGTPLSAAAPEAGGPAAAAGAAAPVAGLVRADDAPAPPASFAAATTRWLELLGAAAPGARRACILLVLDAAHDPDGPAWSAIAAAAGQAARRLALRSEIMTVRNRGDLLDAFVMMGQSGVDGVVVLPTPRALERARDVAALATRHRLPLVGGHRRFADAGALMSYGVAAQEPAPRFELVINAGAARALGLTIPPSLRRQASAVLE